MKREWFCAILASLILLSASTGISAQGPTSTDAVISVIQQSVVALPVAFRNKDAAGLDEYLAGPELQRRRAEIQGFIAVGAELRSELRDFAVVSVTFPQPDRATVVTAETWYEWLRIQEMEWELTLSVPQRYQLSLISGRWYIVQNELLEEPPPFKPIAPI